MAREPRQTPVTVYIEPSLWILAQKVLNERDITASSYIRNLVIEDLRKRGILTPDLLAGLLTGTNMDSLLQAVANHANKTSKV